MSRFHAAMAGLALGVCAVGGARAADQPFYANKTVTFLVGLAAGGAGDLSCRTIAQDIPKYIPGNPTIIVKNMPSEDGVATLNLVGKGMKKDGLTLFCGGYGLGEQLTNDPSIQVDISQFKVIGGDGSPSIFFIRKDVAPGIKTGTDLFDAKGLVIGGFSSSAVKDIGDHLALEVLGIKDYRYVTGFSGSGQTVAAFQQKFINLLNQDMTAYVAVTYPTLIKSGDALPLFESGLAGPDGHLTVRDAREPDVPTLREFYQAKYGKPPTGDAIDLYELLLNTNNLAVAMLALPPGSPPEAVKAMQSAVGPLNQDPDFVSRFEKMRGAGARLHPPEVVQAQFDRVFHMRPALVDLFKSTIAELKGAAETAKH